MYGFAFNWNRLPLVHMHLGWGEGGSSLLYTSIAYYIKKKKGGGRGSR